MLPGFNVVCVLMCCYHFVLQVRQCNPNFRVQKDRYKQDGMELEVEESDCRLKNVDYKGTEVPAIDALLRTVHQLGPF